MEGQLFNSGFRMANDAMLHTYYDAGQAFAGLPISHSDLLSAKLMDEDGERLVLSLDPNVQLALEENITIVCVGSLENPADCVACCGTHPSTSGQVGLIKIYKMENYKGMFRIYFDAGADALSDYQ